MAPAVETAPPFSRDELPFQRALMDHLPSMLAYWDANLRCRFANRAYERWFGVDPVALIGRSLRDLLGPELFSLNEPHICGALRGETQTFERIVPGPDGVQRHSLAHYIPHRVNNVVVGFLVEITETTLLKKADAALKRSEEFLREVFMRASEGILVASRAGRFVDINDAACTLLGYRREELIGMCFDDLVSPTEAERLRHVREQLRGGACLVEEWEVTRKDGSIVPVEIRAKFLSDGRRIGFMRDITEHRQALKTSREAAEAFEKRVLQRTEQLRQLCAQLEAAEQRERQQIAQDLHDDLGQTLAAASIRLASLLDDDRDAVRATATAIAGLIQRANCSTRSLAMQLSPPVLYQLGLVPALEWLSEDIERTFGLKVSVHDDGDDKPLSRTARSILYRATRELLINVAKHARADCARVETRRDGDRLVVRVSDAGVGFEPAQLAAQPGTSRGLGMLGVSERLSFIGGSVAVTSSAGAGTVTVLTAPLAPERCT